MANTTNYNWETPDDTDLVKDGAAAIRTLGSSIDTTTKNLNPETTTGDIAYRSATANTNTRLGIGTTGQVLTVAAGVPSWATPTTGDIEGVTAGTGISGGGTSGTVTVTNSMATAIDAKGDLIAGTGADTFARLAVGTNGHTLVADSAETTGLKWAAPAGGSTFAGCNLNKTGGNQSISSSTWTKVTFNNELIDTDAFHDNSTNNTRITIPSGKAGYYEVTGSIGWGAGGSVNGISIYKNNSRDFQGTTQVASSGRLYQRISTIINLSVGDYVELAGFHDGGGSVDIWDTASSTNSTTFAVQFLGA